MLHQLCLLDHPSVRHICTLCQNGRAERKVACVANVVLQSSFKTSNEFSAHDNRDALVSDAEYFGVSYARYHSLRELKVFHQLQSFQFLPLSKSYSRARKLILMPATGTLKLHFQGLSPPSFTIEAGK